MKIFSLQSKTSVVIWVVILGISANLLSNKFTYQVHTDTCNPKNVTQGFGNIKIVPICFKETSHGFPLKISQGLSQIPERGLLNQFPATINFIFWIAVVFILLSLIRHFISKPKKLSAIS